MDPLAYLLAQRARRRAARRVVYRPGPLARTNAKPIRADPIVRRVLAALLVLNCADAVATMAAIELGIAVEANPLMRVAYEWGPGWFVAVKFALVSGGVRLLWALRARRAVLPLGAALTALYGAVIGLHVAGVVGAIAGG